MSRKSPFVVLIALALGATWFFARRNRALNEGFGPRPASTLQGASGDAESEPASKHETFTPSADGLAPSGRELPPDRRIGIEGERERLAAYKRNRIAQRDEREARLRSGLGAPFASGDETMRLVAGLEAVRDAAPNVGKVVKKVGPWTLRERTPDADDSRLRHYDPKNPPVVQSETTERIGIVTGQFIVRYRERTDPRAIASAHGLGITGEMEHARRVFLNAAAGGDLLETLRALQTDASVEEAELDVLYDRARVK